MLKKLECAQATLNLAFHVIELEHLMERRQQDLNPGPAPSWWCRSLIVTLTLALQ